MTFGKEVLRPGLVASALALAGSCGAGTPSSTAPVVHTPGPEANECVPGKPADITLQGGLAGHVNLFCANGNDQYQVVTGTTESGAITTVVAAKTFSLAVNRVELVISGTRRGKATLPFSVQVRAKTDENASSNGLVILYQLVSAQGRWKGESGTVRFGRAGIDLDVTLENGAQTARLIGHWRGEPRIG